MEDHSVPCMTPDLTAEKQTGLSNLVQRLDLRVSGEVLVEPDEITFVCFSFLSVSHLRYSENIT